MTAVRRVLPLAATAVAAALTAATARSALSAGPHKAKVSRPQGWISPALVVDGRIEGTWEPAEDGRARVTPFDGTPYDREVPWLDG